MPVINKSRPDDIERMFQCIALGEKADDFVVSTWEKSGRSIYLAASWLGMSEKDVLSIVNFRRQQLREKYGEYK